MEDTKVTTGDAGFHLANAMKEIVEALEHIAMAARSDKEIFTKLTEAVEQLTKNNLEITSQLSDSMRIKLEVDKKLNIKAAKGQHPEGKILA